MVLHLGRRNAVIRRCWQEWTNDGRLKYKNGSDLSNTTTERGERVIIRTPDSSPDLLFSKIIPGDIAMNHLQACQTFLWPSRSRSLDRSGIEHIREVKRRWLQLCWNWLFRSTFRRHFGKKYRRTLSGNFISLCHVGWQFIYRQEVDQCFTYFLTL